MRTRNGTAICPLAAAMAVTALVQPADAGPCSALPDPTLVIESGDTQEPLLKALGKKLRDSATPMTVLYKTAGTCTVMDDLYNARSIAQNANLLYAPSAAEDPTWTPSAASATCTVDAAEGLPINVGIGATFLSSCSQDPPPDGIGLITGPIQGYGFIVPKASTQEAIVAEEGYFTFGYGSLGQASPWIDEHYMFIRPATKSTALTLAAAIGVPANKLKGVSLDKSTEVLNLVATSPDPEKTIGLMGTEIYDNNRDKVTLLAFKAYQQRYAYYPDSSPTSFDKRNLRDGHYVPWAPTIYITAVDGSSAPTNTQAALFIELVLGKTTLTDVDGLSVAIAKGLIPDCAMKVSRPYDGGDLSLYSPAEPCGCYYESKVPGGSTTCTSCSDDTPCGGGKCRHGYCEAR